MEQKHELSESVFTANPFSTLPPLSLLEYLQSHYSVVSYSVPGFVLGIVNCRLELPAGQHAHSDYEFFMPLHEAVFTKCDDRVIKVEKQRVIPFNSGQYHGPGDAPCLCDGFMSISCEKAFIDDITRTAYDTTDIKFENKCFELTRNMKVILNLFIEEEIYCRKGSEFIKENLAGIFIMEIIRLAMPEELPKPVVESSSETKKIKLAQIYLAEHYNSEFSLKEVADIAGLSPYHFIRVFRKQTGKTPYDFFLEAKIERASEQLMNESRSITDICLSCGFNNPSHFSSTFKKKTGICPSEYRRMMSGK